MSSSPASIVVRNVQEHEILSHPLVLLDGYVHNVIATKNVSLEARLNDFRSSQWPISVSSGHFKAFVLLPSPGKFAITVRVPGVIERIFCIEYRPPITPYVVKFHYQTCSDSSVHNGFDASPGVDNSDTTAIAKVRFNALLLQMATAELLHAAGLPRQTFAMEFAADGLPDVNLLRCSFTNAHARSVDGQELIKLVEKDILATGADDHPEFEFKHAVVLGCSRYNTETRKAEGHTALGGGKVGVFGSCGLHTWPTHLGEVTACCLNNTRIDQRYLLDDSCFRGTYWANYSTGIGAMLHEIGHTFGLGHATSGIMARGFDDMNKLLCIYEADPHSNHAVLSEVTSRGGAHWNSGSAQLLRHCPWISGYAKSSIVGPTVSWDDYVRGPVGNGQYNGTQVELPETKPSMSESDEIGAVMVDAGKYVNRLETFTRAQVAEVECNEPLRAAGDKHWFVLAAGEYISRVDVRAMAWVDGLQLHTNLRSSRWFGGTGGTLHALQVADGWRVSSFFGTRGDSFVGKLGLRCLPLVSPPLTPHSLEVTGCYNDIFTYPPAGKALEGGPKASFSITLPAIGSVVVRCQRFVESIRLLSPEQAATNSRDPKCYRSSEHVFQLASGEKLVKLEVYSGHWVDCVRFTTTLRVSPWFGGGRGPNNTVMECPVGHHICGLHGSHGKQYLGSVGALYCADPKVSSHSCNFAQVATRELAQPRMFWIMKTLPLSNQAPDQLPGPPLGILVGVQGGSVTSVQSFDSASMFDELVNQLHTTFLMSSSPYQVHCVPLAAGEKLVQINVSYRPSSAYNPDTAIDGACFHTTTRCSTWFGEYRESSLHFFMAPPKTSVIQLTGTYTNSVLTDLAGVVGESKTRSSHFVPDARVLTDNGTYDVRLEAASPDFGIQNVLLVEKNNGDNRDQHAWTWDQPGLPCPRVWRLPQKMLEDQIDSDDRQKTLFEEYIVGAIDSGGAYSKIPAPAR